MVWCGLDFYGTPFNCSLGLQMHIRVWVISAPPPKSSLAYCNVEPAEVCDCRIGTRHIQTFRALVGQDSFLQEESGLDALFVNFTCSCPCWSFCVLHLWFLVEPANPSCTQPIAVFLSWRESRADSPKEAARRLRIPQRLCEKPSLISCSFLSSQPVGLEMCSNSHFSDAPPSKGRLGAELHFLESCGTHAQN